LYALCVVSVICVVCVVWCVVFCFCVRVRVRGERDKWFCKI
jgi:hypothetical protein